MHAKMNGWAGVRLVTHCLNMRSRTYVALNMLAFVRTPQGMPRCLFNKVWVSRYALVLVLIMCAFEGSTSWVMTYERLPNCSAVTKTMGQDVEFYSPAPSGCNVTQWGRYENGSTPVLWCTLWGSRTRLLLGHRVAFGCSWIAFFLYNVSESYSGVYYRKGNNCTDKNTALSCFNLTVRPQVVQSTTTVVTPAVVTNSTASVSPIALNLTTNFTAFGYASYLRKKRVENGTLSKNITNLAFTYGSWGIAMLLFAAVMVLVDLGLPQSAWRRWRSHVDDEERGLLT
nr:membrane protein UL6 [Human betaherpesvirus 5]